MTIADDIARIIEQEAALVFERFDEETAFALGAAARDKALTEKLPVVIDIRTWDRALFFCALPGSVESNADWVRRKVNTVRRTSRSSFRVALEQDSPDGVFAPRHGLDPKDFALAGGCFPIRLVNAGVIGTIGVSGLPSRDDHVFVVDVLARFLGQDPARLALA